MNDQFLNQFKFMFMNFENEIMQLHLSKHQEKSFTYVIIDYIKWIKLSILKLIGVK